MPADGGDGAPDGLLEMLGDPPVVLFFKVADGDDPVAGANGKLGLGRRPAHKCGGPSNSEKYQGGLITSGRRFPD